MQVYENCTVESLLRSIQWNSSSTVPQHWVAGADCSNDAAWSCYLDGLGTLPGALARGQFLKSPHCTNLYVKALSVLPRSLMNATGDDCFQDL